MKLNLNAEPETIEFDPERSAIVVIDMQNFDIAPGGLFDLTGVDTTHGKKVIEPIKKVLLGARRSNVPVFYTQNVIPRDPSLRPTKESPWYQKAGTRNLEDPTIARGACVEGNWGAEIVSELAPVEGDIVFKKTVYSGFVNTEFDSLLRRRGIKYLFLAGIGTPTCVEATARDAYFREYWPILLSDCCGAIMPETHEAALFAIKRRYGWVTTSSEFLTKLALAESEA